MVQNSEKRRYFQRIKKLFNKGMIFDFISLFVPVLLLVALFFMTIPTYGMSLLLVYFILPMFYALDKRIRYDINGIGTRKVSFINGYKAFFLSNKGGIFGLIPVFFEAIAICLLSMIIVGISFPKIVNCFPESITTFHQLMAKFSSAHFTQIDMIEFLLENAFYLTRPLTVFIGVAFFLPLFFIVFFGVNESLVLHYISTILFPDLNLNVSSSQSRSVAKSFSKGFTGYRLTETIKLNLPLYLIFCAVYGFGLYLTSQIQVDNTALVPFVVLINPAFSLIAGTYLNHFCLANAYIVVEENQMKLKDSMPMAMQTSIYQTFHAKEYIHGVESKSRGCFISSVGEGYLENMISGAVVDFSKDDDVKGDNQV